MTYGIKGKHILVTGGTGQIGSFLVEALIEEGSNITVLGRDVKRLKEIKSFIETRKVEFVECDLTNEKSIGSISSSIKDVNYLVHLSSEMSLLYPTILENAHYSVELEIMGTVLLLRYLKGIDGILYSSSMAVYGQPAYLPVDEKCPLNPISFYGCGKFGAEKYLKFYSVTKSIPLTILRYSGVYGPRNRTNRALPFFIDRALHDESITLVGMGKGFRDLIYVSDVVDTTKSAIKRNESDTYNIGSGIKCTMAELAKKIIEFTNSKSRIVLSEKPKDFDFVYDISKAKQKLCFTPRVSLEEGLVEEITWHKKNIQITKYYNNVNTKNE